MCAAFSALSSSAFPAPLPVVATPGPFFSLCVAGFSFSSFSGRVCCGPCVLPLLLLLFCSPLLLLLATGASVHRRGRCIGVVLRNNNGTSCDCSFCVCVFSCCLLLVWLLFSLKGRGINSAPLRHIKVTQDTRFVPAGAGRFLSVFCAGLTVLF